MLALESFGEYKECNHTYSSNKNKFKRKRKYTSNLNEQPRVKILKPNDNSNMDDNICISLYN